MLAVNCALLVGGRPGPGALFALWRQLTAHDGPGADQNGGAHNRRRCKCGKVLQHNASSAHDQRRPAAAGTGIRGDLTRMVNCPHLALYPQRPADRAAAGAEAADGGISLPSGRYQGIS
ncbi:MAG TPA: hypothetical protein VIL16_10210 [Trebonia sp.]